MRMAALLLATTACPRFYASSKSLGQDSHGQLPQLDEMIQEAQLKLMASLEKVVTEAEAETQAIADLHRVLGEAGQERKRCTALREEALSDVAAFRQELEALAEINRAAESSSTIGGGDDQRAYDWSALSLLGERSVASSASGSGRGASAVVAGVKKAAELHFSVVKAAQAAATVCGRRRRREMDGGNAQEDPVLIQTSRTCTSASNRLREAYDVASRHLGELLENSEKRAADDACFLAAIALLEDRRRVQDERIREARRELCEGHLASAEAEALVRKVQDALAAFSQGLLYTDCAANRDWRRYVAATESLIQLAQNRPTCPQCCQDPTAYEQLAGPGGGLGGGTAPAEGWGYWR